MCGEDARECAAAKCMLLKSYGCKRRQPRRDMRCCMMQAAAVLAPGMALHGCTYHEAQQQADAHAHSKACSSGGWRQQRQVRGGAPITGRQCAL